MQDKNTNPVLKTRQIALQAMQAVIHDHGSLDDVLARDKNVARLAPRDRAYLMALCGVTLRHAGEAGQVLEALMRKPLPAKAQRARFVLLLGSVELLFLQSAPHGVVHSWVELAGQSQKSRPYKGLINGILRNVDRQRDDLLANADPVRNIPEPLRGLWARQYGRDAVQQAAAALTEPPPVDLTLLRNAEKWRAELGGMVLGVHGLRVPRQGAVENLPGFSQGDWIVQDVSAALPATLLHVQSGERVLDMCAAPGGKSMQLAAMGAQVTALEKHMRRFAPMRENLSRTGMEVELVQADAAQWRTDGLFDAILVDAPCSASGIFRHHPDVLYSFAGRDLMALNRTQLAIGKNAASLLRPGGRMVYCVCSAQAQEGEELLQRLLPDTGLVIDPIAADEAGIAKDFLATPGWIRIPPGGNSATNGMDAFFMARLRKPG